MAFIQGDNDANLLTGGVDSDIIWGNGGNDTITGNGGNDEIDGGTGVDTIAYTGTAAQYEFDMVIDTNTWRTEPNYQLHFTLKSFDLVAARDGNDELDDVEYLQFANGTAHWYDLPVFYTASLATNPQETLYFYGGNSNDTMVGHAGGDYFIGGSGNDTFDGKEGVDYVSYAIVNSYITMPNIAGGVTVNLGAGTATGVWGTDTFTSIEGAFGTAYNDLLIGGGGYDYLDGGAGDDVMFGGAGNDTVEGNSGLDWLVYLGNRDDYFIDSQTSSRDIYDDQGNDGIDEVSNVERVQFADEGVAFDIDGNAGDAARLIGVLLGGDQVQNPEIETIFIQALDDGYTVQQLAGAAIDVLYPNYTPSQLATVIYQNVFGSAPTQSDVQLIAGAIAQYGDAFVTVYAGDTVYNDDNIDLVGLQNDGVPFEPFLA